MILGRACRTTAVLPRQAPERGQNSRTSSSLHQGRGHCPQATAVRTRERNQPPPHPALQLHCPVSASGTRSHRFLSEAAFCLTNVCPVVPGVHRVSGRGWWGWLLLCWPGPGFSVLSWISTVSAMPLLPARFGGRAGKVVAEPGAAAPDGPARLGSSHDRLACRLEGR